MIGVETMEIDLIVNQKKIKAKISVGETLLSLLRRLGYTGIKEGCGEGECGTCTVLINGDPVNSCLLLAANAANQEILTIEGLKQGEELHPLQQAFIDEGAVQCGFCTSGMILTLKALADKYDNPTTEEIKIALAGNLCRCTGYIKILKAAEVFFERRQQSEKC